jgi:two-component system cell cycle sensor histidine kinase/response regulator CckA
MKPGMADRQHPEGKAGRQKTQNDATMLFRTLMDHLPDNVYFKDRQSRFILVNRALAHVFGLRDTAAVAGKTDFDFFLREHAEQAFVDEQAIMRSGRPIIGKEEKETWPDGRVSWVSTTKVPLTDNAGNIVGTCGISRDITAHREAELALRASEQELRRHKDNLEKLVFERTAEIEEANRKLQEEIAERAKIEETLRSQRNVAAQYLRIAGVMFVALDTEGRVTLINQKGCEVLGTEESGILGMDWFTNFIPERIREEVRSLARGVMNGETNVVETHENPVLTASGEERLILWHNTLLTDQDGSIVGTLSSGEDVTDRRRMAIAQRESERLEAVGNLAKGVAYNFNTILSIIMDRAASVSETLIPGSRPQSDLQRILDAARHAGQLTKRLLGVASASRSGVEARIAPISVAQIAREAAELTEETFSEFGVTLDLRNPESMPMIMADGALLVESLMNLFLNSAEAMPNGGMVRVDCIERRIARPRMNPDAPGGTFVGIRISDSGEGMTRSVLSRIFDPFFSTKSPERSFGLGLSVAQRIIKSMGGWIDVRSHRGKGSVFRVFLPKAEPIETGEEAPSALPGAGKTVLVIDDDPVMVETLRQPLEDAGFSVLAAGSADEGVRLFADGCDRIDLTIVDLIMPDKSGKDAIEAIMDKDPEAMFVVTSGFSRDYVRQRVPAGAWAFLQKPFLPDQTLDVIHRALSKGTSR